MSLKHIVKAPSHAAPMPMQRFREFQALTPLYIVFFLVKFTEYLSCHKDSEKSDLLGGRRGRSKIEGLPLSHLSSRFRDSQALALGFLAVVVKADNKPASHPPAF